MNEMRFDGANSTERELESLSREWASAEPRGNAAFARCVRVEPGMHDRATHRFALQVSTSFLGDTDGN